MTTHGIDPALSGAYETCRRMQRRHDPTFYVATRRLPRTSDRPSTPSTATSAARTRSSTTRAATAAPRPAGPRSTPGRPTLEARHRHRAARAPGGRRARRRRPPPRPAARRARARTWTRCASTAPASASRRAATSSTPTWRAARPPWAASWRRCSASPRPTRRVARLGARLPAGQLRPRRARGLAPGPHLPARPRGAPPLGSPGRRRPAATPALRELVAREVRRARAPVRERRRRVEAAPARAPGHPPRPHDLPPGARPRRALGYDVLGRRARLAAWELPARRAGGAAPVTRRATQRGASARRSTAARRRPDLRRELRRAWPSRASWRGMRRRRARRRPLRDRRARDVGVRDRRRRGWTRWASRRAVRQELPVHELPRRPTARARYRLPWSWSSFDYRTLCEELWAQCGDARFETAKVAGATGDDGRAPTAATLTRAAGRRRAGLAARARPGRPTTSRPRRRISRGLEVHPARAAATTSTSGSTAR